ncbi:MAG: nucleotidyltransferase substrate binding protein [Silvanigrellales bacterium]|nr:nucleotidyltransferase substrate binding protein [Silvanigrellales bacterium]
MKPETHEFARALKTLSEGLALPKTVVREMAQNGLISDVSFWLQAIDQRALSSHTDKEEVANEVYAFSQSFLPTAKTLLEKLNSL